MRKRCRKRIPPSVLGHMGKVRIFEFFQKIPPLGGGQPEKVFQGYPQGPGGGPCQIWMEFIQ